MVDRPPSFPRPDERVLPGEIHLQSPPSSQMDRKKVDSFIGSIVGLATGDALGASVEFRPHDYFISNPVRDMQGGGTWGLRKGQWTDDTSMALCLASSLITKRGYDPYDQMVRYKWWYHYGYLSSTGKCFDIGNATRDALDTFSERQRRLMGLGQQSGKHVDDLPWELVKSSGKMDINCSKSGVAGNGALMRLAPLPLFFYQQPELAVEYAGQSARLTHGDQKAVDACRYYAALIVAAVNGESKEELLSDKFYKNHKKWFGKEKLHKDIARIAEGSFQCEGGYNDGIRGAGYVVKALEAALWAFWSDGDSFERGALAAVNLGDDTDTTAAIYGQLAGAYYGFRKIPSKWSGQVYAPDLLTRVGEWLYYCGSERGHTDDVGTVVSATAIPNNLHTKLYVTENPTRHTKYPDASSWESPTVKQPRTRDTRLGTDHTAFTHRDHDPSGTSSRPDDNSPPSNPTRIGRGAVDPHYSTPIPVSTDIVGAEGVHRVLRATQSQGSSLMIDSRSRHRDNPSSSQWDDYFVEPSRGGRSYDVYSDHGRSRRGNSNETQVTASHLATVRPTASENTGFPPFSTSAYVYSQPTRGSNHSSRSEFSERNSDFDINGLRVGQSRRPYQPDSYSGSQLSSTARDAYYLRPRRK